MARHAPDVTIAGVAGREWSLREGRQATLDLLKLDEPPTALVASSVELALGGMLACRELGVRIPDDLALAAFDDAYFAELLDPPLTAVAYQPREVGEAAASLLVEAMGEDEPWSARLEIRCAADRPRLVWVHGDDDRGRDPARRRLEAYGTHVALRPTDLEIGEGEFFCLLGPSGCGKTTTLNLIGGFVNPVGGEIWIRDERVDSLPPHRRRVNTVFQSYALFPHMTVRDNVGFGLKMARVPTSESRGRIEEALRLVGLEEFGDRLPGQLSGGQQQRVAVARALVNRPAVLLLDEPLGALDLKLRHRLQIELAQIHRDVGTTFVYVTHDQEEAMSMATRIAVMSDGGDPADRDAERDLLPAALAVRRRLHRRVELPRRLDGVGHGAPGRRPRRAVLGEWLAGGNEGDVDGPARGGAAVRARRGAGRCHPRDGSCRRRSSAARPASRSTATQVDAPLIAAQFGRERIAAGELTPDKEVALWWDAHDAVLLPIQSTEEED